jgi:hypothetical protein
LVTDIVSAIPPPTEVDALPVLTATAMLESAHAGAVEVGLGDALADGSPEAAGFADADADADGSGEGDIDRPKLGDALGSAATGSSLDPNALCSNHHASHRTMSRPTTTAARRRQ